MGVRHLKICLIASIALLCWFSAAQNFANLMRGYETVRYVTSMQDHSAYPSSIAFGFVSAAPTWISYAVILFAEVSAGVLAARGTWDLWSTRKNTSSVFNGAKTYAMLGVGAAMLVWFSLFTVIGGAYFGMWQTSTGATALAGAFQYATLSALILIFINMPD